MDFFELILSTLISAGFVTAILVHWYDKKLRTHEVKVGKYIKLTEELAKFVSREPDWEKLRTLLNEALLFASDEVVEQILEFNKKFTASSKAANGRDFQMSASDLQPLVIAIRKDLYLKSESIKKLGLTFFQKP